MSASEQPLTVPRELTSPKTKLVYVTVRVTEETTVNRLQNYLGLPKLTLLPILRSLVSQGYVQRTEGTYECH
ncbi:MarR family transcriptional regulator [Natrinema sp. 74]|uniref:MarR family transcriptional regulator n=1 Tax=Natrinema sp. 74 TaxID=3384159 RepID=UPI0038D49596